MAKTKEIESYNADNIKVLEGLEAVRKRPGMYIGSTGEKGLHHMIWEIVDNAVDEVMGGFADTVKVTILDDEWIRVEDNGRGIPTDLHPKTGKSTVETVLTVLHAGGKFDNNSYKVSGGLHGVGASVVNALSSSFKIWVYRDMKVFFMEFKDGGLPLEDLKVIDELKEHKTGTMIEYKPDYSIMEKWEYDSNGIQSRLQQLAFLNKGLKIIFEDKRVGKETTNEWHYEGGIKEYIEYLNSEKEPLIASIIYGEKEDNVKAPNNNDVYSVKVEVAFQYNKTYNNSIYSFCNNINTTEGGTHEDGFRFAITKIINKYALEKKFLKEGDEKISKEDVSEGLTAVISVKHPNPQYEGQTKRKFGNTEVRSFTSQVVGDIFERFMLENPEESVLIIKKALLAMEARKKSQEARDLTRRKSPFDSGSLPGKLADCSTRDASISEVFIVEGDSAGGSAKMGRNRYFQAILPLRGKILNVEKAKLERIFENAEISTMVTAIGAGINPEFDLEKIRYNKIIIMTDADVDGAHIRILLLTFFFRYMQPLLEKGHVFIAQPPLFKVGYGKTNIYMHSEIELEEWKRKNPTQKYDLQRYKGLGEMDAIQLWETTMDPEKRVLLKVSIEDAAIADKAFSLLMGDEVLPRKQFIEKNAKNVRNIDF
ncbi:DNA topoisomerase (ATP-hydrolyzing) subunit B [[Mycoplasma] testudinis]|uniref:DNA topoisomerase (ATP-hydrolyzing) subunit B n=1 Tax=[Mycoplasma] testudinis TaxID=33924 RepID=UPI0004807216|nr:DNA topoisomerase (ATP-hydrolyzing) subunit B [[Mycoplasma] testudinis]